MSKSDILVSVWMAAYYAGANIAQGIESILMQETEYPYEIVISDDCSGDNTWDVVSEYVKKYPDLIRAVRNEQNLGLSKNVLATKMRCRGKYIVNLSGDDYWIDKDKIQKQVDFLESHPDYIGVGSKVEMRYDDSAVAFSSYPPKEILGKDFTIESYNKGRNMPSHGFMIHNIFKDEQKMPVIEKIYGVSSAIDDLYDPVLYLQFGKIFIMEEATCVYRVAGSKAGRHNFNSARKPLEKALMILDGYTKLESLQIGQVDLTKRIRSTFDLIILNGILLKDFKMIGKTYKQIPLRYRKPWFKSVGFRCMFTVWRTGFRFLRNRLKKRIKKQ